MHGTGTFDALTALGVEGSCVSVPPSCLVEFNTNNRLQHTADSVKVSQIQAYWNAKFTAPLFGICYIEIKL